MKCLVCENESLPKFTKSLGSNFLDYCECVQCGHLTLNDSGLNPDYSAEQYFLNIDTGWEARNSKIISLLRRISFLPGLGLVGNARVLDYGSGIGRLVSALREDGYDAYGYEPFAYIQEGTEYTFKNLSGISSTFPRFDMVTLIEVLEHIKEPQAMLAEIGLVVKKGGYLFISTGIYERKKHNSSWYYLYPEAGHVSIYSATSLQQLLSESGFRRVLRLNETMWLFRYGASSWGTADSFYFWLTNLRVMLKPTNLLRLMKHYFKLQED